MSVKFTKKLVLQADGLKAWFINKGTYTKPETYRESDDRRCNRWRLFFQHELCPYLNTSTGEGRSKQLIA